MVTSTPRQVPYDAATVVLGSVYVVMPMSLCVCTCLYGTCSDVNAQSASSWDVRLRAPVRPPPRRAQLRLPGRILAGAVACRVRPAASRARTPPTPRLSWSTLRPPVCARIWNPFSDQLRAQQRGVHPVLARADGLCWERARDGGECGLSCARWCRDFGFGSAPGRRSLRGGV